MAILKLTDICKDYVQGKEPVRVLKNVNLTMERGDYLAIMGPSGSGKTTLMNLIGCLDVPTSGSYLLGDREITKCSGKELAVVRNKEIGFVFQSFHLLPKLTALDNVALPLLYGGVKKEERRERARAALETVGLSDRVDHRPDQLSGGQCQRVAIARAIVGNPKLLLADEPTGALDSASGAAVMELFQQLHDGGSTIIMITHDLGVVASMCEKIAVMYAGHIVEYGTTDEIFYQPGHEYTKGLINSIPKLNTEVRERLVPIEGTPVDLLNPPAGCPFAPRCKNCMKICLSKMPPRTELSDTHYTYCWLQQKAAFEKGEKAE